MSLRDWWTQDSLIWQFRMTGNGAELRDGPGLDAPIPWVQAFEAVARDLRCLRYGRELDLRKLVWELVIGPEYAVTVGWAENFRLCHGLSMDAPFVEAAVWVADTVQWELSGYEFVQWPSAGRHLLLPRARDDRAVWVDPHNDEVVAVIGELCDGLRPGRGASGFAGTR